MEIKASTQIFARTMSHIKMLGELNSLDSTVVSKLVYGIIKNSG